MKKIKIKRSGDIVFFIIGLVILYFSFPYAIQVIKYYNYDIEFAESLLGISINFFYTLSAGTPFFPFTYPYASTVIGVVLIILFFPLKVEWKRE